jgi:hypothetical protein
MGTNVPLTGASGCGSQSTSLDYTSADTITQPSASGSVTIYTNNSKIYTYLSSLMSAMPKGSCTFLTEPAAGVYCAWNPLPDLTT